MTVLDDDLLNGVRAARSAFFERVDPVRPELHRYCRRLTGGIWDAEDLVQETLTRAFSRAADSFDRIDRVLPWLIRIATNIYIDAWRRPRTAFVEVPDTAAPSGADPIEVRDALGEIAALLAPQERGGSHAQGRLRLPARRHRQDSRDHCWRGQGRAAPRPGTARRPRPGAAAPPARQGGH